MSIVTIEEAQARLMDLIDGMSPGEEVIITRDAQPVARLLRPLAEKSYPVLGRGRGKVIIVSEDEEHLKDFEDYMS